MKLRQYLSGYPVGFRAEFAERVGLSYSYLSRIASGLQRCSPDVAARIERESGGEVPARELRPDIFAAQEEPAMRLPGGMVLVPVEELVRLKGGAE